MFFVIGLVMLITGLFLLSQMSVAQVKQVSNDPLTFGFWALFVLCFGGPALMLSSFLAFLWRTLP